MTVQRQWEIQLSVAVRAFLDRHGLESQTAGEAHADFVELDKRMNAKFRDEWIVLRAEREAQRQQDFADAGHPDPEEAMAEAEAQHDLAANR